MKTAPQYVALFNFFNYCNDIQKCKCSREQVSAHHDEIYASLCQTLSYAIVNKENPTPNSNIPFPTLYLSNVQ